YQRLPDDLPEGVLAGYLPARELEEVDTPDLDTGARSRRPGQGPFGHTELGPHPVASLTVVHVRDAFEPLDQAGPHGGLSLVTVASRCGAARRVEDAVVGEEPHYGVEVVAIEGLEELLE